MPNNCNFDKIFLTLGAQLGPFARCLHVLRDDNKYEVFLDLEMKLSGVSSSAVK